MKYLRKEKARGCIIHNMVMEAAKKSLELNGSFCKERVLEECSIAIEDPVRWDYIREFIEMDEAVELLPVAASYFKRHDIKDEIVNPTRYIATGHGKKTAGFVSVTTENDHLAVRRVEIKEHCAVGVVNAFQRLLEEVEKVRGTPVPEIRRIQIPEKSSGFIDG